MNLNADVVVLMSDSSPDADFPPIERESVRERLAADRASTSAQIAALRRDFDGIVEANALVAIDDEHDPEGSSTAFERAHVAALLAQTRDHLADLDRALERLERGDYGRCEGCGEPIPAERLEVRPAASTCVRCAAARPR
ncbi:DnaK suppressor protein [Streptomyces sp. V1I1]|nr:DnaK suppressor protein [Streptomyces sp. V1I1]